MLGTDEHACLVFASEESLGMALSGRGPQTQSQEYFPHHSRRVLGKSLGLKQQGPTRHHYVDARHIGTASQGGGPHGLNVVSDIHLTCSAFQQLSKLQSRSMRL